jgi:hypothetical protein
MIKRFCEEVIEGRKNFSVDHLLDRSTTKSLNEPMARWPDEPMNRS